MIRIILIALLALSTTLISSSQLLAAEKSADRQTQFVSLTVNLNKASAEELAEILTGIGLKKAQTIIAYRDKIGTFKTVDQLLEVKGIGVATLEKNRYKLKL